MCVLCHEEVQIHVPYTRLKTEKRSTGLTDIRIPEFDLCQLGQNFAVL